MKYVTSSLNVTVGGTSTRGSAASATPGVGFHIFGVFATAFSTSSRQYGWLLISALREELVAGDVIAVMMRVDQPRDRPCRRLLSPRR